MFMLFCLVGIFLADLAETHESCLSSIFEHLVTSLRKSCTTMNLSKVISNILKIQRNLDDSDISFPETSLLHHFEIIRYMLRRESLRKQLNPYYLKDLADIFWCIACSDDGISFRIVTIHELLPSLMKLIVCKEFKQTFLQICWNVVQEWATSSHSFCDGITLLCSFIEFFFPESCLDNFVLDLCESQHFFEYIQSGLLHEDFTTRKRASICLRRTVDFSVKFPNLNRVWTK